MNDSRVAARYVKSLLGLAVERGALEQVHADMQLFTDTVSRSRDLLLMLRSPIVRHEVKHRVLHQVFAGKVHELTFAIMNILTKKNREPLLPSIAREFHEAYNEYKGIGKAEVVTTLAMDASLRAEIDRMARELSHKKTVELHEKVDPELIGGFILNVGDQQVDASIKSRLKALKLKFNENPYVKQF
jgi:F-type H+-transporting ATPase subunit delta